MYKLLHIESGEYVYKNDRGDLYLPTFVPYEYRYVCSVALWKNRNSIHNVFVPKTVNKFRWDILRYRHTMLRISDEEYILLDKKSKILFEVVEV